VLGLHQFFARTLYGKAILATAENPSAARLVGINVRLVLAVSFALSAMLGAVAGIVVAPIALTSYNMGVMIGLKGFAAAMLGGIGNPLGAVLGGLLLGVVEAFGAGYLSSAYKDAIAFLVLLLVLLLLPNGLLGRRSSERV
jgi:branched-chain amino acid transport system permease protein